MVAEYKDLVEELGFLCEAGYFKIAFLIRDVTYLYTAILTSVPTQSNMIRYAGPSLAKSESIIAVAFQFE